MGIGILALELFEATPMDWKELERYDFEGVAGIDIIL